jgi:hypothetical protein
MSSFSSTVQVLTIESEMRKRKKDGAEYPHWVARCILLDDNDNPVTVGAMRVAPDLRTQIPGPGKYRVSYSMQVPDWGDNKGEITPTISNFMAITSRSAPKVDPLGAPKV